MNNERTSPMVMLRHAKEFAEAASTVRFENKGRIFIPAYYLIGHSIELSLKAFLLGRGIPTSELRKRKFGHNLEALLTESRKRKLGNEAKLSHVDVAVIKILNFDYSSKRYEYLEKGGYQLPQANLAQNTANKLLGGLNEYCSKVTREKFI